jgi:zinc transport system ATP-binding protein
VDIEIRRGELWFLIGPNGSGKSTFLRALLGVIPAGDGLLDLAVPRRRIGFVPQRCDIKPTLPMTVSEFVTLGLEGSGARRGERARLVAWALDQVGLKDMDRSDYWALSGGQRQRALVARGLVRRPELLVLDEPTSGLDLATEESLLRLIAAWNVDQGLTVLFVVHAIAHAARFATHVALFHGGKVLSGPREKVLVPETIRAAYGADVGHSLLHGEAT